MHVPLALIQKELVWRRIAIAAAIAVLAVCAIRAIAKPQDGDFKLHWETGRRFLAGEFLYAGGHDFPYPPFVGMVFAPAALLPMPVAKIVCYPAAIAALWLLLWIMRRLGRSIFLVSETHTFWTSALALLLTIQFVIRDQAELGFNTAIVALVWLSVDRWRRRRDFSAGVCLGAAVAIKCTPAIFLGYFIWKRQWRMALFTIAATLFFTAAPMIWQGPASWSKHMATWSTNVIQGISGVGSSAGENEYFSGITNISLRPAVIGLCDFFTPAPSTANSIATLIILALFGFFLWWSREKITARDEPRIFWELATAGILMVLLSPITWTQHCVATFPACYLIAALLVTRDGIPRWVVILVSIHAMVCAFLGRDLVGRNAWLSIAGLHVPTLCLLGLFAILIAGPRLSSCR